MLESLKISWCRSYAEEQTLIFDPRLTLILGHNGAGKTTLLESLKASTIGVFPPNSESGRTFVTNPQLVGKAEVTGSLNLKFRSLSGAKVELVRNVVVADRKSKLEVKKAVNIIKSGDQVRSSKLGEMNAAVPNMLGVSAAVLENISFCHQEQALWPFTESGELKRIMDEIFETEKFTKVQDSLAKLVKQKKMDLGTLTIKLECKQVLLKQLEAEEFKSRQVAAELTQLEKDQDEKLTFLHKVKGDLEQLEALRAVNEQRDMRKLELATYESIMDSLTNPTQLRNPSEVASEIENVCKLIEAESQQQAELQQTVRDLSEAIGLLEKELMRLKLNKSALENSLKRLELNLQGKSKEGAASGYLEEMSKAKERIAAVKVSFQQEMEQLSMQQEDMLGTWALLMEKKQEAEAKANSLASTVTVFTQGEFRGRLMTCKASELATRWVLDVSHDAGADYSSSCNTAEVDTDQLLSQFEYMDLTANELQLQSTASTQDLNELLELSHSLGLTSIKALAADRLQGDLDTLRSKFRRLCEMQRIVKENYRNRIKLDENAYSAVCARFDEILRMTDMESELSGSTRQIEEGEQDMSWLTYQHDYAKSTLTKLNTSSLALKLRELRKEEEELKRRASLDCNADKIAYLRQEVSRLTQLLESFDMQRLNQLKEQYRGLQRDFDESQGKVSLYKSQLKVYSASFLNDVRKEVNLITIERELGALAAREFDDLSRAIERGVLEFHNRKLNEVNNLLQELWTQCYQGSDIEGLQLRADQVESSRYKNYNYRLVCRVADHWMDMKGRCSAGQKMLASILLRVALAQAFSADCGVLALDEPTMNLDRENAAGLAEVLGKLSKIWPKLQLIVITHDRDFSQSLLRLSERNEYYMVQRKDGSSVLELVSLHK
mmetsp:Transcript_19107/g.34773  ORF Transcript_19107/g.34773 Transcript_19107/m.34773 type:complete len:894 (-) Transcript_19107:2389-5070(-)